LGLLDEPVPTNGLVLPLTLETGAELATEVATKWSPEGRLISASGEFPWQAPGEAGPESVPSGGWLRYSFAAGTAVLSVLIDRQSGVVFSQRADRIRPAPTAAPLLTTYPISSTTALLSAERIAGTEYRRACSEQRPSSWLSLTTGSNGRPWWVVTYASVDTPNRHDIRVVIDAQSGAVESKAVVSGSCG
jgi:hypothetical protein